MHMNRKQKPNHTYMYTLHMLTSYLHVCTNTLHVHIQCMYLWCCTCKHNTLYSLHIIMQVIKKYQVIKPEFFELCQLLTEKPYSANKATKISNHVLGISRLFHNTHDCIYQSCISNRYLYLVASINPWQGKFC